MFHELDLSAFRDAQVAPEALATVKQLPRDCCDGGVTGRGVVGLGVVGGGGGVALLLLKVSGQHTPTYLQGRRQGSSKRSMFNLA